jgi:hypothetical protein
MEVHPYDDRSVYGEDDEDGKGDEGEGDEDDEDEDEDDEDDDDNNDDEEAEDDSTGTGQPFTKSIEDDELLGEPKLAQLAEYMRREISDFTSSMRAYYPAEGMTHAQVYAITIRGNLTLSAAIKLRQESDRVKKLYEPDGKDARQAIELAKQVLKYCSANNNDEDNTTENKVPKIKVEGPEDFEIRKALGLPDGFKLPEDRMLYALKQQMDQAILTYREERRGSQVVHEDLEYMVQHVDANVSDMVSGAIKCYYVAVNATEECEREKKDARRLMVVAEDALSKVECK